MYSGTTLTKFSGRLLGAHQKLDRAARNNLATVIKRNSLFPSTNNILQFEGKNGPDGIKRKSPAVDEPWHYYSPFDDSDSQLIELINYHYLSLVKELKAGNQVRIAFEAAWLAHALTDGLTPAHHYPYEEKLTELRGGEGIETRTSIKEKWLFPGETRRQRVQNNWKVWGPKGLFTAHGLFEFGIATIILPLRFKAAAPSRDDLLRIQEIGVAEWFRRAAREIAVLDMFADYYQKGWTPKLARQVRQKLAPTIVLAVTVAWYAAMVDAELVKPAKPPIKKF